jgi:hypothetical protein
MLRAPLKKSQFSRKRQFTDKSMIGWIQVRAFINNIIFRMAHGFYDSFFKISLPLLEQKSRRKNDLLYPLDLCIVDFISKITQPKYDIKSIFFFCLKERQKLQVHRGSFFKI